MDSKIQRNGLPNVLDSKLPSIPLTETASKFGDRRSKLGKTETAIRTEKSFCLALIV
jgi:hypothetical protein